MAARQTQSITLGAGVDRHTDGCPDCRFGIVVQIGGEVAICHCGATITTIILARPTTSRYRVSRESFPTKGQQSAGSHRGHGVSARG